MYLFSLVKNVISSKLRKGALANPDDIVVLQIDDIKEHLEAIYRSPYKPMSLLEMDRLFNPHILHALRLRLLATLREVARNKL